MNKIILSLVFVCSLFSHANAGWRCNRGYGHTLYNSSSWSSGCWNCHPRQKTYNQDWRSAIAAVANRQQDNIAFESSLSKILGVQQQQYPQYQQNTYSELTQQFAGSTAYGVQGYSNSPLVDLNAVIQGQRMLAQQLSAGATQSASDTADITNQAYALENDRQVKIAQLATIASVGSAPVQQPTSTIFRQQTSNFPVQAEITSNVEVPGGMEHGLETAIKAGNCAACHTGQGSGVVKLDLSKLDQPALEAMANAVDTGKMPLKPDGSPGEKLPLNIRQLFNSAAWPNK